MARTKEYNEQAVRDGLLSAFHRKGFGQTSLVDLENATGLNRRQLYNDFGDKRTVFLQALEHFGGLAGEQILCHLEEKDARLAAVESTLFGMIDLADTPQGRLTSREPVARESDVRRIVDRFFRRIERGYRNALTHASKAGELPATARVDSLARFFLGIHIAICVMGHGGEEVRVLRDVATEALGALQ